MKKAFIILLAILLSTPAWAVDLGQFVKDHTQRLSVSLSAGGVGASHTEAVTLGASACLYGVYASASYGFFDNFDYVYPFCKQHSREFPILSEVLFGYSFPFWSNIDYSFRSGYTLYLTPVYGWYNKEYSYVSLGETEYVPYKNVSKASFGIVATLRWYHGSLLSVRASGWGGEICFGHTFFSPYRKRSKRAAELGYFGDITRW